MKTTHQKRRAKAVVTSKKTSAPSSQKAAEILAKLKDQFPQHAILENENLNMLERDQKKEIEQALRRYSSGLSEEVWETLREAFGRMLRSKLLEQFTPKVRLGGFNKDLLNKAQKWEQLFERPRDLDDLICLGSLWRISEIYDRLGFYGDARRVLENEGPQLLGRLEKALTNPENRDITIAKQDRMLWRERLWVLFQFSQCSYRLHEYSKAKAILVSCRRFLFDKPLRHSAEFPCNRTLARLYFLLGQNYRQLYEYDEAEKAFVQALAWVNRSLHGNIDESHQQQAQQSIARIQAFGLGWIIYARGDLQRASPFLLTGRALLASSPDKLHEGYANLVLGCMRRSEAGYNVTQLDEAKRTLETALRVFKDFEHKTYEARTQYELALCHLYWAKSESQHYVEADQHMEAARVIATASGDRRWLSNLKVVESRCQRRRGQCEKAEQAANEALRLATVDPPLIFCQIEAWIARGEALLEQKRIQEARTDFEQALKAGAQNRKTSAVSYLLICKSYTLEEDRTKAEEYFREWEKLKGEIANALVQDMAQEVRANLDRLERDFTVSRSVVDLNFEKKANALRKFLVKQAGLRCKDDVKQMAELLGTSPQTVYNWLNLPDQE
jgi:tetratricopeptide (TPR) repeat protein